MSIDSGNSVETTDLKGDDVGELKSKPQDQDQPAFEELKIPSEAEFLKKLGIFTTHNRYRGSGECSLSDKLYPPTNPK